MQYIILRMLDIRSKFSTKRFFGTNKDKKKGTIGKDPPSYFLAELKLLHFLNKMASDALFA